MSDEIKERQKALQAAIRALQNKKEEIQILKEKEKDFEMGEVSGVVQKAKTLKRQSIINFVLGKAVRTEVNAADKVLFQAERDDLLASEMVEALESTLRQMAVQISDLQKAIESAKSELWEAVYNGIKISAQTAVGNLSIRAMGAGSRIGKSPQAVLLDLFGTGEGPNKSIHFEIINAAAEELKKEYGLSD